MVSIPVPDLVERSPEKSTNVRPVPLGEQLVRRLLGTTGALSPGLAARLAEALFFWPPPVPTPEREVAWRQQATTWTVPVDGRRLAVYSWGDGPAVLLTHGWQGRGTQLGAIATALAERGYRAIAFDAPAHGRSSGHATAMTEFLAAMRYLADAHGPFRGVVGHSMGAAATAIALAEGLPADCAVLVAAPSLLDLVVHRFAQRIGLSAEAEWRLCQRLERRFGAQLWRRFSPLRRAAGMTQPALIIADRDDAEIPHHEAVQLHGAWPRSQLLSSEGLGHTRILRDPEVVAAIVRFVTTKESRHA